MGNYHVSVLKVGYSTWLSDTRLRADGTITLITGPRNILVDTGGPRDINLLIEALNEYSLMPTEIDYVVCTHGHSDHVGNLNLFPDATIIVSYDVCYGDLYDVHDFASGVPYIIDDDVQVIATPGHTDQDVSVVVRATDDVIVIAGDLFESEEDLTDEELWKSVSMNPALQEDNRKRVLEMATYIVPGHGDIFRVR